MSLSRVHSLFFFFFFFFYFFYFLCIDLAWPAYACFSMHGLVSVIVV